MKVNKRSSYSEDCCYLCGMEVEELFDMGESVYHCTECDHIFCGECYSEDDSQDIDNEDEEGNPLNKVCPICGGQAVELSEDDYGGYFSEDYGSITMSDMFD